MNSAAGHGALRKDVLGRIVSADAPHARQREIYLSYKKPSRWDWQAGSTSQTWYLLLTLLMGLAGVGTGLPAAYFLPDGYRLIAWAIGGTMAIAVFWYLEFRRPYVRKISLHREALKLADSPTGKLQFTNGMTGYFSPKEVIQLESGSAIGFDPQHQLIRYVFVDGLRQRIWFDWVLGLDECRELAIVELPCRGVFNTVRRLLGGRLRTETTLVTEDMAATQGQIARISPENLDKAQRIVREMNFHRPKSDTAPT